MFCHTRQVAPARSRRPALWAWPWALTLNSVAIGVGAGYMAMLAVLAPPRIPDAHKRSAIPAVDGGNMIGLVWAMIGLIAATAVPPALVVLAGTLFALPGLRWTGIPAGIFVGAFTAWLLGRVAYRRLETGGPELLHRLRGGRPTKPAVVTPNPSKQAAAVRPATPRPASPDARKRRLIISLCADAGWIPLLSGVLSLANAINQEPSRSFWTFVLNLPGPLRIPASVALIALSAAAYALAASTAFRSRRDPRRPRNG